MEAQAVHQFFFQLMVILLSARLFGELFARLESLPVVGELLAGVILGLSLLGWMGPRSALFCCYSKSAGFGLILRMIG